MWMADISCALSVWKPLNCPVASIGQRETTELSTEKLGDAVSGHFDTVMAREEHFQFGRRKENRWIDIN